LAATIGLAARARGHPRTCEHSARRSTRDRSTTSQVILNTRGSGWPPSLAANAFLETAYWADHTRRFAQAPASAEDFHQAVPRGVRLDQVFRLEEKRTVSNDWVVRYDNRLLQLERQSHRPPARSTVRVFADVAGQLEIRYRDRVMRWTELATPAAALPATGTPATPPGRPATAVGPQRRRPCADHLWRRVVDEFRIDQQLAADRKAYEAVNPCGRLWKLPELPQASSTRDISNELRTGTFLTSLDTTVAIDLTRKCDRRKFHSSSVAISRHASTSVSGPRGLRFKAAALQATARSAQHRDGGLRSQPA
jgi:hypothetical protein